MNPLSSMNPLLVENYDWVDEQLHEQYYRYLFIYDKYQESGIFKKKFPFNLEWKNILDSDTLECLDDLDVSYRRARSENDISDYKEQVGNAILRLNFQTEKNLDIPRVSILSKLHECYNCCPCPSPISDYDADIDSSDFGSLDLGSLDLGSDDLESVDLGSDCN